MAASRSPQPNLLRPSGARLRVVKQTARGQKHGIALALGGGFSRGFAHLGVLDVLERERIPISSIVGTSIGGLLGAAYADGISVQELCELGRHVRIRDFIRFHKSGNSGVTPVACDRIGQFVREWFHVTRVEELPIRTAIVTTDLEAGATYVFHRGPLDVAIRASCAFPGLFQPVEHEGRRLVDGCLLNPVPTAVAARMGSAYVLGVGVGSSAASSNRISDGHSLTSSWTAHADIVLEPEVNQIDWNDFSRVDEAFAAGADAMRHALPRVRELLARRPRRSFSGKSAVRSSSTEQTTVQSRFAQ